MTIITPEGKKRRGKVVDGVFTTYQVLCSRRWVAAGLCASCGKPRHSGSGRYCKEHHLRQRNYQRKRIGAVGYKPDRCIKTTRHKGDDDGGE